LYRRAPALESEPAQPELLAPHPEFASARIDELRLDM
jgi:hypothetical protein